MHAMYVIVVAMVSADAVKPEWECYTTKNSGRHNFQVDLAMELINYAIEQEWDGVSEQPC